MGVQRNEKKAAKKFVTHLFFFSATHEKFLYKFLLSYDHRSDKNFERALLHCTRG